MADTFYINSVDITDYVKRPSCIIEKRSDNQSDAYFDMSLTASDLGSDDGLLVGKDVEIYDGTDIKFGGIIKKIKLTRDEVDTGDTTKILVSVTCTDYNDIPGKRVTSSLFPVSPATSVTAGEIVTAMVTDVLGLTGYDDGVTLGTIDDGATLTVYSADAKTVKEVLDDMAEASGYKWYIDDSRALHFVQDDTVTDAPYDIIESGATFTDYDIISVTVDNTDYVNKQWVLGAVDDSGETVNVSVEDSTEISDRATIEGRSGVYGGIINATNTQNTDDAAVVAANGIKTNGKIPYSITFTTTTNEFEAGTKLLVNLPTLGISEDTYFLIESVIMEDRGTFFESEITATRRSSSDFSTQRTETFEDYFAKLVSSATSSTSVTSGISGAVHDIVESADLPIALSTTTVSRSFTHSFPDTVDILTTLTFQYTATSAVELTLEYKEDTTTLYSLTMDLPIGTSTKTIALPEVSHANGEFDYTVELTADADSVLQLDSYQLKSRWEKYSDIYTETTDTTPAPSTGTTYEITIDHTLVDADLTDYPVLVKLEDWGVLFDTDETTYYFTDSDGVTELSFERAYYSESEQRSEFHVKIPLVSSTVDTVFYLKTGATSDKEDATNVWDTNFVLVQHMGTSLVDSTGNGWDGTNVSTTIVDGRNGKARDFGGSSDEYRIDIDGEPIGAGDYTLTILHQQDNTSSKDVLLSIADEEDTSNTKEYFIELEYDLNQINVLLDRFSNENQELSFSSSPDGEYRLLATTLASDTIMHLFIDGVDEASLAITGDIGDITSTRKCVIGASWHNGIFEKYFGGLIDEVRISNTVRSDAWLAADDHNLRQNDLIKSVTSEGDVSYTYSATVAIDSTKVDADLTDYPVMVKLTSSNFTFSEARSSGVDIIFTDNSDNILSFERAYYDDTLEVGVFHVKIPSVLSSSDTTFKMKWGSDEAVDEQDVENTWDGNFVGVWHMGVDVLDSTQYANDSDGDTDATLVTGLNGYARSFDGANDEVTIQDDTTLNFTSEMTAMAVINPDSLGDTDGIVSKRQASETDGEWAFRIGASSDTEFLIWSPNTNANSDNDLVTGSYQLVAVTHENTGSATEFYIDGASAGSSTSVTSNLSSTTPNVHIGFDGQSGYFDGLIDEVRLSNIARSAAWNNADYYNLVANNLITIS